MRVFIGLSVLLVAAVLAQRDTDIVDLVQSDFDSGTYIISRPGRYRLAEDISFNPNSAAALGVDAYSAGMPLAGQPYDADAYRLGFFAAIAIETSDVELDLNGHRLEQSAEHALLQRFFALIELADQPFISGQGPNNFGACVQSARRVTISNGVLGRSSHHGIHGNGNAEIEVRDVEFVDYEVAAIALNGVNGLRVLRCTASNRKDVPVLGTFSAAMFIKRYVDFLVDSSSNVTLELPDGSLSAVDVRDALRDSINAVHADVLQHGYISIAAHPSEYALYHNPLGLLDGNSYSFLTHQLGVAVNGFPTVPSAGFSVPSSNVLFRDVSIGNQSAFINEIVALSDGGAAVIDPVGAVFQIKNTHPLDASVPVTLSSLDDSVARYTGNVVANAQLLVAKAALQGAFAATRELDVSRLSIGADIVQWAESGAPLDTLFAGAGAVDGYVCNGDSMFHVNKGVIGFKIDATQHAELVNIEAHAIANYGQPGSTLCGDYSLGKSHPAATLRGYGGADTRGVSLAGSTHVQLRGARLEDVYSASGEAVGIDVHVRSSHIDIRNVDAAGGFRFAADTRQNSLRNFACRENSGDDDWSNDAEVCVIDNSIDGVDIGGGGGNGNQC